MIGKPLTIGGEPCYVYILQLADNSYYTGMTNDYERRFKEHREGHSKSTKGKLPMKPMYLIELKSRQEARDLEVRIKSKGARLYMMNKLFEGEKEEGVILFEWWEWKRRGIKIDHASKRR